MVESDEDEASIPKIKAKRHKEEEFNEKLKYSYTVESTPTNGNSYHNKSSHDHNGNSLSNTVDKNQDKNIIKYEPPTTEDKQTTLYLKFWGLNVSDIDSEKYSDLQRKEEISITSSIFLKTKHIKRPYRHTRSA